MVGHADQNLIDAHDKRMEGLEDWCRELGEGLKDQRTISRLSVESAREQLQKKASTSTVIWGVGVMIVVLGSLLAIIWGTVIQNGNTMHIIQRNQDLVLRALNIEPVK